MASDAVTAHSCRRHVQKGKSARVRPGSELISYSTNTEITASSQWVGSFKCLSHKTVTSKLPPLQIDHANALRLLQALHDVVVKPLHQGLHHSCSGTRWNAWLPWGWHPTFPSSTGDYCSYLCFSFLGLPPQYHKHNFVDWFPSSIHIFRSWFTCSNVFQLDLCSAHGTAVQLHQQNQRCEGKRSCITQQHSKAKHCQMTFLFKMPWHSVICSSTEVSFAAECMPLFSLLDLYSTASLPLGNTVMLSCYRILSPTWKTQLQNLLP